MPDTSVQVSKITAQSVDFGNRDRSPSTIKGSFERDPDE